MLAREKRKLLLPKNVKVRNEEEQVLEKNRNEPRDWQLMKVSWEEMEDFGVRAQIQRLNPRKIQNKQMSESQPISQLSLMKISSSTASKCTVFCEVDSSLSRYELSLDDATTVETIIRQTLRLVHKNLSAGGPKPSSEQCQLFASRRSGRKVSDLPSLERQQTVVNTGIKCFYLAGPQVSDRKRDNINSVSTKSIQSEMNALKPKGKEVKAPKRIGCFCFA